MASPARCARSPKIMHKDKHSRKSGHTGNYRYALEGTSQSSGSTPTAMDDYRLLGASMSTSQIRTSQSRSTHGSKTVGSYGGASSSRNLGAYGDNLTAHPYAVQANQFTTGNELDESFLTPDYTSQPSYGSSRAVAPFMSGPFDRSPPGYQGPPATAAEGLSDQFAAQPFFGFSESERLASFGAEQTLPLSEPYGYADISPTQQPQASTSGGSKERHKSKTAQRSSAHHRSQDTKHDRADADPFSTGSQLLKQTNSASLRGRLLQARVSLLHLSNWLAENIESLGLSQDIPSDVGDTQDWREAHKQRLKFWRDIHHCWLVFLQRQYDDSKANRGSGSKAKRYRDENLLSTAMLEDLGDEVVRISDQLEKYGLVDYEIGFQEKELITLIRQCIDMLDR